MTAGTRELWLKVAATSLISRYLAIWEQDSNYLSCHVSSLAKETFALQTFQMIFIYVNYEILQSVQSLRNWSTFCVAELIFYQIHHLNLSTIFQEVIQGHILKYVHSEPG